MSDDFPNLGMSIGEYYQMLVKGKRPMRNRNQQQPPPQEQAKPLAPPQSKQKAGDPAPTQQKGVQKGAQMGDKEAHDKKRVEKEKIKTQARNAQDEKKKGEEKKQQVVRKNESLKAEMIGSISNDVLMLQQSTMIKEQKIIKKVVPERSSAQKIEPKQTELEEEKQKDDKKALDKFETITPHPQFCEGRLVLYHGKISQISKVNDDLFTVQLDGIDENIKIEDLTFLSRVFTAKIANLESISEKILDILARAPGQEIQIAIVQKLTDQVGPQSFLAIINQDQQERPILESIKFKESINVNKDIKEYEKESNSPQLTYRATAKEQVLQAIDTINNAFEQYQNKTKQVILSKENMESLLFSIVSYEPRDQEIKPHLKPKLGIFLRAKFDKQTDDYIIFLRLISVKNTQRERTEWFPLSKFKIKADLTKGFVDLQYLQSLENVNGTAHKLNQRAFQMINYWENQDQKRSIREISDIQDHSENPRRAPLSSLKDSNYDRCSHCNYLTDKIEHFRCSCCAKVYHLQCLQSQHVHSCLGLRENQWRCQNCIRCTNCLSAKNRSQLLICQHCNSGYHYDCLHQIVKLSVPTINPNDQKISQESKKSTFAQLNEVYRCEQCVKCEHCGAIEAGDKRQNKWSKDFKLCSVCNKKRLNKQYCQVCEKFWPDSMAIRLSEEAVGDPLQTAKELGIIQCTRCQMWTHQQCDRIFQNSSIRDKFLTEKTAFYNCQQCRQQTRIQLLQQLLDKLVAEDRFFFFQEPVEDHVQNYTKIIKVPMCFKYVRQRLLSYLRNPEQLRSDVNLIFSNAMIFNIPKHRVHKEAARLKDLCQNMLQRVQNALEKNKNKTLDEDLHSLRMKKHAQKELIKGDQDVGEEEKTKEQADYILTAYDLFDQNEHQVPQFFGQIKENNASNQKNHEDLEIHDSDYEGNDRREIKDQKNDDQELSANISVNDQLQKDGLGITKNLRVRKQINYNENQLPGISGDAAGFDALNLSGSKRTFQNAFKENNEPQFSGSQVKGLKRPRAVNNFYSNDNDYTPSGGAIHGALRHAVSATNLLQQALQQEEKNERQFKQLKEEAKVDQSQAHHVQQQQQMMMNYYKEIDDEKCYYSNPARCSFDDPSLLYQEMCYLCGSFGNREDFLSCTLCGESFHTYCLQLPEDDVKKYQSYWKCLNCKFCEICSQATQEAFLLYCDECDKAFHSFCLKPILQSIPNCQWKCKECFKCQGCGSRDFFSHDDTLQKRNLEVTDFEFSQNFTYCYQCGLNEYKKSFCKICQQKNESLDANQDSLTKKNRHASIHQQSLSLVKLDKQLAPKDPMLKCNTCGFYSHARCSRLLPVSAQEDSDQFNEDDYKCLECLLTGKTINHLIRETCEHYENIHQIISRQKLLAQLCQEILIEHFPIPEKAPLFIKSFIEQNYEFFRKDEVINEWLSLLESNVCFETNQEDEQMNLEETEAQQKSEDHSKNEEKESMRKQDLSLKYIQETKVEKNECDLKKWKDLEFSAVFKPFNKDTNQQNKTDAQRVYEELYGYKETFLPRKRSLYNSLKAGNLHRLAQKGKFMNPQELAKIITVPTEENLSKINFSELYVKVELQAVMRIKLTFFRWFAELIQQILKNNHKFIKKEKKRQELVSRQLEDQSEDIVMDQIKEHQELDVKMDSNMTDELCQLEDSLVQNPQIKLTCVLCRMNGEYQVTGRLIPFQVNLFVHVNCALWSTDIYEIGDGQLVNFFFVYNGKAKSTKCWVCGETGATINCFTKKCHASFHFPCAQRNNKVAFLRTKETYCDQCCRYKDYKPGYFNDLTTRRRFQIAKNNQPWNMSYMFQNQIMAGVNPQTVNFQLMALQQASQNLVNNSNMQELEKLLQIEKWRPFYYDMFNRVGNLTVLSLRKEINQIIEETHSKKEINQDQLTDFSAVRIYWKFYKDTQLQIEDAIDPCKLGKTFYLYCNNQIKELIQNDLSMILNYASDQIREKIKLTMHLTQNNKAYSDSDVQVMPSTNQAMFWQKLMQHFQRERPNFSLQNIIFSISEFGGKTKYPISVWNRAEVKNKGFFLKSGASVLQQQIQTIEKEAVANQSQAKVNEGKTLDDIFKRMMQINQVGENQSIMGSMKRFTSSRTMPYEKMLGCLGKKMFYTKAHDHEHSLLNKDKQILAKKIRLTDTIDTNKEIDLPIAMKYRLSKTQPKRVEVGPSKIHRNGLFALEDLMSGDIVIEYVGEKIRNRVADKREAYYNQKGIGDCYLFRLDKELIIDATFFGNKARYLNHSCDANCSAKIINVQGQKHIIISTNKAIKQGEELTYNYNFDYEADKIECFCGAQNCRGRLN